MSETISNEPMGGDSGATCPRCGEDQGNWSNVPSHIETAHADPAGAGMHWFGIMADSDPDHSDGD
jgi:hypothetical protein